MAWHQPGVSPLGTITLGIRISKYELEEGHSDGCARHLWAAFNCQGLETSAGPAASQLCFSAVPAQSLCTCCSLSLKAFPSSPPSSLHYWHLLSKAFPSHPTSNLPPVSSPCCHVTVLLEVCSLRRLPCSFSLLHSTLLLILGDV